MKKLIDVFISVGSNINPYENIVKALEQLKRYVDVIAVSTFYQTKAINRSNQPDFINGIFHIQTNIEPRKLKFNILRKIEYDLGRIRSKDKYSDRTIDLDIAIYGDMVINEPDLVIPDKDIRERPFIAIPLLELSPTLILPDTKEKLSSLEAVKTGKDIKPVKELTKILKEGV
ncbi:MAG: 2-amino-4-hydroxy-6-hydroxymethyldihydropteridine diphosphokinase [Candidatus Poribacteria bacterium]